MVGMAFPERLKAVHTTIEGLFKDLHAASEDARQRDPHLREAVSAVSAALAAVKRAQGHVANAAEGTSAQEQP